MSGATVIQHIVRVVINYQFSLVDVIQEVGRIEYASFDSDAAAMAHAQTLLADWSRVTVLEGVRIVGVIVHPRYEIR
jgi:hypothetical protein